MLSAELYLSYHFSVAFSVSVFGSRSERGPLELSLKRVTKLEPSEILNILEYHSYTSTARMQGSPCINVSVNERETNSNSYSNVRISTCPIFRWAARPSSVTDCPQQMFAGQALPVMRIRTILLGVVQRVDA